MPAETYNAFISYAWVDNAPFVEGQPGWVSTFVDRLKKHLARELGRKEQGDRVWLDYERLRGSDNVTAAIRAKLEASHLLVPILSPGYLASPWCRQELETFIGLHGPDCGRIFPVWMSPTPNLPPVLEALLKYKVWYEDNAGKLRTRWFPEIDPTDRAYGRIQEDMARDMARRLSEIAAIAPPAPVPDNPIARAPNGHFAANSQLVLVNGGEGDSFLVLDVAKRLHEAHGLGSFVPISVLPDRHAYKSSEITKDLRDKLKLATAVLMVYRDGPAKQVHMQIGEYLKHSRRVGADQAVPTLDLCHACQSADLGLHPAGIRVHQVDGDCGRDCADRFARVVGP